MFPRGIVAVAARSSAFSCAGADFSAFTSSAVLGPKQA